jgi:putative transposase
VIDAEKANYPIAFMCRLLRVPRSSFYAWTNRVETPTQARRRTLAAAIAAEFKASRQTSGCRRITAALNRAGIECSVGLVADLMRELGLAAVQPRAYKRTTVPGQDALPAPDLLERDFSAAAPGQRLVGDITYLRTGEGWLYLATVIDLATRMVVGWQLAAHMRTTLVTDALQMAIHAGHVAPNAIFHSDRGTQGGLNRSSQHPVITEVFDGATSAAGGSGFAARDALAGPADAGPACGARVLALDRAGKAHGGRRTRGRRVHASRVALVSPRWRHAAAEPGRAHRPLPVVPRA